MWRFNIIFKQLFLKTHKIHFSFITTPWIHPLKFIQVCLKFPIIPLLICLSQSSLCLSSFIWAFLLNFLFFSAGSCWPNLSTYQPAPIACNSYFRFSFGLDSLGSSTLTFWNNSSVLLVYKLQRSKILFLKAFSQQPI